jgi:type 1 glutamine amidotransferase
MIATTLRRQTGRVLPALLLLLPAIAIVLTTQAASNQAAATPRPAILVFSRTTGYHHMSIPDAIAAVEEDGRLDGYDVVATVDPNAFTAANLAHFRAIVFLLTTGTVLDAAQKAAMERFIRHGGGWLGVHSASDTEYHWPFYGQLVGAYFKHHPGIQTATVHVLDHTNLATKDLPALWTRTDEWYDFRSNPTGHVHVLATVDERTYKGGEMGADHPIAWCHEDLGGRALYTAMGHTSASYHEPLFLAHLRGALQYVLGHGPACG